MFFYQIGPNTKLPLKTKLGMILGIIVVLSILAVFAFTLFVIALCGGLVLLITNLFRKPKVSPRSYDPPRTHDDVIDI